MYKRDIIKTIGMIVVVLIVARFYNGWQNDKKVYFFMHSDKVVIYDISYEEANGLSEVELQKHVKKSFDDVGKVVASSTFEDEKIDTSENNYGKIYHGDKVYEAKFINYALAFSVIGNNAGFFRYKLFDTNLDSIVDID